MAGGLGQLADLPAPTDRAMLIDIHTRLDRVADQALAAIRAHLALLVARDLEVMSR